MDDIDRAIIERLQDGIEICERPYQRAARRLGLAESELIERLRGLLDDGRLSRFGPLFDAERLGGAFSLCALAAPADRFDQIAALVNAHDEVAHNYARDHALNMWFVLATETPERIDEVAGEIEHETGCKVFKFPKIEEFHVGLRLSA
ncbi:MAG: AsnC family transcriptional regulator [Gammaproteobacteria bacterium]|nr:AsnC family transcriptional regulator [Gammaproteobacteria bacterium]